MVPLILGNPQVGARRMQRKPSSLNDASGYSTATGIVRTGSTGLGFTGLLPRGGFRATSGSSKV